MKLPAKTTRNDRRMTVKEVAAALGVSDDTILNSLHELGFEVSRKNSENPKGGRPSIVLDEAQVTAVKMNLRKNSEVAAQAKTDLEKALFIKQALIYQEEMIANLQNQLTAVQAAYGAEVMDHKATKALLAERETGLEVTQRLAEAGGIILSDSDDLAAVYRRRV